MPESETTERGTPALVAAAMLPFRLFGLVLRLILTLIRKLLKVAVVAGLVTAVLLVLDTVLLEEDPERER